MGWFKGFFKSSIGRKFIMSLSGLFLCLFLLEHVVGNSLLLVPDNGLTFNAYSEFMATNPIIRPVEVLLFAAIIFHFVYALILTIRNNKSRPVGYEVKNASDNSSWTSRHMWLLGVIILLFIILHLSHFFATARITGDSLYTGSEMKYDANGNHDLYSIIAESFRMTWYTAVYIFSFIGLSLHLFHGFFSGFRTLGLRHPKYLPAVKIFGYFFSVAIPAGFAVIALYFYFGFDKM